MKRLQGGAMAALVALLGAWSCSRQVMTAEGGGTVGSTSTSGGGGFGGGGGATSGGGLGGAGGAGCPMGDVTCAGVCTNLTMDPSNCGACGTVCSFPHAAASCVDGACVMGPCDAGWADCDHLTSDGCEIEVADDPMNCGACGDVCVLPHATAGCTQGMCTIASCDAGWTDCDELAANGCEADLQHDDLNCGSCGNQCQGTQPCCNGLCGLECPKGYATCPGAAPCDFCGTMLGTNQNCNFCGDACALPNATSQCTPDTLPPPSPAYVCALVSCNAGFADCDMVASNGCEVDTTSDPANCGGCGSACAGGQMCVGGACQ